MRATQVSTKHISHSATATLGVVLWLVLTFLPLREAGAQGAVYFSIRFSGLSLHIWGPSGTATNLSLIGLGSNDTPSGTTPFSANGMAIIGTGGSGGPYGYATTFAQLIGAVGADQPESALVPVGQITSFRSGTTLGSVVPITDTLSAVPPYTTTIPEDTPAATFEIVAWDNSSGLYPTWVQASVAWQNNLIAAGHSGTFTVTNIGGFYHGPPNLNNGPGVNAGLRSFNLFFYSSAPNSNGTIVTTLAASNVTASTATLNGTVNPNGLATSAWFQWGQTTNYGAVTAVTNVGSGTSAMPVSAQLSGLCPNYFVYHFRLVATNSSGTAYGADQSFSTLWSRPLVTTEAATGVTTTSATLNGTVYAADAPTTAWFVWDGGVTAAANVAGGGGPQSVSATVSGLSPGSSHWFTAVAGTGCGDTVYGNTCQFTTHLPPVPTVTTLPAVDITSCGATLNGSVDPSGIDTYAAWQYGTNTSYGSVTPWASVGSGWGTVNMTPYCLAVPVPGTTIHFRVIASNYLGLFPANDLSFTTLGPLTINCGSDNWKPGCTNLSYKDGAAPGRHFILLQSASPIARPGDWTRVATNDSTPGNFAIPPVGTAGPIYYRVMSE